MECRNLRFRLEHLCNALATSETALKNEDTKTAVERAGRLVSTVGRRPCFPCNPKFSCNTHNYQDQIKSKVPVSAEMFQVEIDLLETKLEEGVFAFLGELCGAVEFTAQLQCRRCADSGFTADGPGGISSVDGQKAADSRQGTQCREPPKLDCTDMPVSRSCLTGLDQMRKQKYSPESRFVIAGKRASRP